MPTPKYSEELERSIIAVLLTTPEKIVTTKGTFGVDDFYFAKYQTIYKVCLFLSDGGFAVDIITVTDVLEKKNKLNEIGGRNELVSLTSGYYSSANLDTYIAQLRSYSKLRREYDLCQRLGQAIQDENAAEISSLKATLLTMESEYLSAKPKQIMDFMPEYEAMYADRDQGIMSTFLPSLNYMLQGFKPGELITLTGLSGAGKSILSLQFAFEAAKADKKVLYFNLEMSLAQFMPRVLTVFCNVDNDGLRYKNLPIEDVQRRAVLLEDFPLKVVFEPVTTDEIYAAAQYEKATNGLDFIIVDYFSLLRDNVGRSELEHDKELIIRLKNIAKRLNVPVFTPLALSKVAAASTKKGRDPSAEDQLGSIMQVFTVDVALSLQRNREELSGRLFVTKNRTGNTGSVDILFDKQRLIFTEVTQNYEPPPQNYQD